MGRVNRLKEGDGGLTGIMTVLGVLGGKPGRVKLGVEILEPLGHGGQLWGTRAVCLGSIARKIWEGSR